MQHDDLSFLTPLLVKYFLERLCLLAAAMRLLVYDELTSLIAEQRADIPELVHVCAEAVRRDPEHLAQETFISTDSFFYMQIFKEMIRSEIRNLKLGRCHRSLFRYQQTPLFKYLF